ncbi:kinase-like protein [Nemania sp. FL0031]|nr:kinase-like protein [Nemania sp. FL0031]
MSRPYIPLIDNKATQSDGTTHLAINNTLFRQATTMAFVADKTSVPVPRVYCSCVYRNWAFITMERSLSDTDREHVFQQLRDMIGQLRALPPPSDTRIESCVNGSLRDSRIPRSRPRFGPFKTVQDFHFWLREYLRPEEHPERNNDQDWMEFKGMVAKQDGPWPPPVFTHGDLNPFDIFLRGSRVYTLAWYGNLTRRAWQTAIDRFLDVYSEELKMEIIRQKWWGECLACFRSPSPHVRLTSRS